MDFGDITDDSSADLCSLHPETILRRSLVAHLGGDASLLCNLLHLARFPNRTDKRLLAVDVLAKRHRDGAGWIVMVVRRRHGNRIDLISHLGEHLAVVTVDLGIWECTLCTRHLDIIRITERNDVAILCGVHDFAPALATNADTRKADLVVGTDRLLYSWLVIPRRTGWSAIRKYKSQARKRCASDKFLTIRTPGAA